MIWIFPRERRRPGLHEREYVQKILEKFRLLIRQTLYAAHAPLQARMPALSEKPYFFRLI